MQQSPVLTDANAPDNRRPAVCGKVSFETQAAGQLMNQLLARSCQAWLREESGLPTSHPYAKIVGVQSSPKIGQLALLPDPNKCLHTCRDLAFRQCKLAHGQSDYAPRPLDMKMRGCQAITFRESAPGSIQPLIRQPQTMCKAKG